jgi:hypothetical protein
MPYENLPEANLLRALIETGEGIIEASRALLDIVEGRIQVEKRIWVRRRIHLIEGRRRDPFAVTSARKRGPECRCS